MRFLFLFVSFLCYFIFMRSAAFVPWLNEGNENENEFMNKSFDRTRDEWREWEEEWERVRTHWHRAINNVNRQSEDSFKNECWSSFLDISKSLNRVKIYLNSLPVLSVCIFVFFIYVIRMNYFHGRTEKPKRKYGKKRRIVVLESSPFSH